MKNINILILLFTFSVKTFGQNKIVNISDSKKDTLEYTFNKKLFLNVKNDGTWKNSVIINDQEKKFKISEIQGGKYKDYKLIKITDSLTVNDRHKKIEIELNKPIFIQFDEINKVIKITKKEKQPNDKIKTSDTTPNVSANSKLKGLETKKFKNGENILFDAIQLLTSNDDSIKKEILYEYKIDYDNNDNLFLSKNVLIEVNDNNTPTFGNEKSTNITKTDVTNFATGMARFLADRAKAEMNESFFIQMRKQMEKMPELQAYFPESYLFLKRIDANSMNFDMEHLKSKFEKDINVLPRNILNTISIADDTKYPYFKTANNYLNNNVNGLWMNVALHSALESNGKINPKDFLYQFVHAKNAENKSLLLKLEAKLNDYNDVKQVNLINSIKLAELVSNSLLSPETGKYWVSSDDINELINNEKLFQTYIGLLLAKSDFYEYKIMFNNKSLKTIVETKFATGGNISDLTNLKKLISEIYQTYQNIEDQVNIIKTTSNERELAEKSYQAFDVVKTSVFTIQNLISKNDYLGDKVIINTEIFSYYIDPSVEVAYNLFNKKYNLAIKNFIVILNQVPTVSKFITGYDLVNLVESIDFDNTKQLNGQKIITTFLQQKDVKKSLIENNIFSESDITAFFKNDTISKTDLLKLVTSKEKEINNYLAKNKDVQEYFNKQSKDYNNFISKFTTYGTLIANVALAQNSTEVKDAISASVLPVGSSRVKRNSNWSVTMNAFVGGFAGKAYYKEFVDDVAVKKSITSFGIIAPIGISINKGNLKMFNSNTALGLTLQVIDLGSLVNFYVQKGDGAELPNNSKIELGDIIAPGAMLTYSLGDSPFTILGGVQYVPNLSRMESIPTNKDFKPLTWRMHFGIAIDIPLFNLKVWN